MNLNNACVIVTGSGEGIGRAIALAFADAGARVVCCGRRQEPIDQTAELIRQRGGMGLAVPCDVTKESDVDHLVRTAEEELGPVQILFNNAGRFHSLGGVMELDAHDWWQDVTVNLLGPLLTMRRVLPGMIERNEGIIINMDGGRPVGGSGYASSKAGLVELTRVANEELKTTGSDVLLFVAGPGLVRTSMTEYQANSEMGRKWIPSTKKSFDEGKTRQPEEVAERTIKLCSSAKKHWSGRSYNPSTNFDDWPTDAA